MNKTSILFDGFSIGVRSTTRRPQPQRRLTGSILLTILTSAGVFQAGCNTNTELKVAQYELTLREEHLITLENFATRTPDIERAILNEEERIITLKSKVYGQTGDDKADKIHGSGPYNAYLVIAKRPPIKDFLLTGKPMEQRFIDDRIRSLPDVISVKLLRRVAQDSSGPTKDPLGILNDNPALQDCLKAANPTDPLGLNKEDENKAKQRKTCIEKFGK